MNLQFKERRRSGLTLVELMVVLIIVVIVTLGFGSSASRQVRKTNRDTVVNELEVLASNISDAYYDMGNPAFNPTTDSAGFRNFLTQMSSNYTGYTFDFSTLTSTSVGFTIEISDPLDVYEQRYGCWFVTREDLDRYVIIASGGDDGIINFSGYSTGDYADDIVLVVKPKNLS